MLVNRLRCSIGLTCALWAACSFGQSSPTPIAAGSAAKVVCKSESEEVVLHATTSAALPIVDILPCGAEVTVVSKQAGWYRVRTKGGKEGYVKDTFFATPPPQSVNAQPQDAATMEAQYKTCAKHSIPVDKCSPEIYQQLKAKDEAPLDVTTMAALKAVKHYQKDMFNPGSLQVHKAFVLDNGEICLQVGGQNQLGGMAFNEIYYSSRGVESRSEWGNDLGVCWRIFLQAEKTRLDSDVTEKVQQALKDGR